ncbi:very low-density lipoprotein receptor-like [Anneissia japonica]|uniref:very low-density lipoprotein receptor-like n=1 Tax=Anneissia japonica TaxID=1529436 RepID=UPI001425813F|nr:very low-density lipoprotein receptor-like [Anneissia japonica]
MLFAVVLIVICASHLAAGGVSSSCPDNYFECAGGPVSCVPDIWVCDGDEDCWDGGSDEVNCNTNPGPSQPSGCDSKLFTCDTGECINKDYVCDGEKDCLDNSDEGAVLCKNCYEDQHQCDVDVCIPRSWVCDGEADCTDGTDERRCW